MRRKYEQEGVICEDLEFFFPTGGGGGRGLSMFTGGGEAHFR